MATKPIKFLELHYTMTQFLIISHRKYSDQHNQWDIRAAHGTKVGCNTVEYTTVSVFWLAVFSMAWYKVYYYSFKIFPRFWLVRTTSIIHHNQLLFSKFGKNLRHIESMTSKVQPVENYWTNDVKMTSKVQPAADYWTVDRENLGTRLCYIFERKNKERKSETPLRTRKCFEWIIIHFIPCHRKYSQSEYRNRCIFDSIKSQPSYHAPPVCPIDYVDHYIFYDLLLKTGSLYNAIQGIWLA